MKPLLPIWIFAFTLNLLLTNSLFSQDIKQQTLTSKWSMYIGYNASWYTKSNFKLTDGNSYNFTLTDVKAKDVDIKEFRQLFQFYAPYNFRIAYQLNPKWRVSIGSDHMKYQIITNQTVKIDGEILPTASLINAGIYNDDDIQLKRDFFYLEHTDGLNFVSAEADYTFKTIKINKNTQLELNTGAGIALMVPRTESYIFNQGQNNPYHVSGYGFALHAYPRLLLGKHFFLQNTYKFGYINLSDVLLNGPEKPDRATQSFSFAQINFVGGWRF